jgi:hypothetical protein
VTGRADRLGRRLGGEAGAGGDVEHPLAGREAGRAQQEWDNPPGHHADAAVVPGGGGVAELEFGHGPCPSRARHRA